MAKKAKVMRVSDDEKTKALIAYVLGWITGIIILLTEKDSKYVRYHAWQSIFVFGAFTVAYIILGIIGSVAWMLWLLISLLYVILDIAALIIWIVSMVKAYQGEMFEWPVAGQMAKNKI